MSELKQDVVLAQDLYPGCYLEPAWSRVDSIRKAPEYAMRLALGANVIQSPRGHLAFTSIIFDGKEFILHRSNYDVAEKLANSFLTGFLWPKGYGEIDGDIHKPALRYMPNLVIEGMSYMQDEAIRSLDVPLDKSRMVWIVPDLGACGDHRSNKPFNYLKTKQEFFTERVEFASPTTMPWFDAFIMHRCPQQQVLAVCQQLRLSHKVLLYEMDDDIFSIPSWNHNAPKYTPEVLYRAELAMEIADVGVMSTEELCNLAVDKMPNAKIFLAPNLIDMHEVGDQFVCDRELNRLDTYTQFRNNGREEFRSKQPGKPTIYEIKEGDYDPVIIMWAGSNTHDKDLEQIIPAVLSTGKRHGLGVRFVFFGYCPAVFMAMASNAGNTNAKYVVRDEYQHFITYIPPVVYGDYYHTIRELNPDIALCPLTDHPFNLSKSNLKFLEMSAFGIPVIASNFGPYASTITHGVDGLLVEVNDTARWNDYIETMIQNVAERRKIGSAARVLVRDNYSWQTDNMGRKCWDDVFQYVHQLTQERRQNLIEQTEAK